jgi:aspartyl-tRNA(Asn)/glutamyl-tRNA(Gln) amidotransferase subunit A
MTRTVTDAALMLSVMSEPDVRDWTALPHDPVPYHQSLARDLSGLRIAWSPTLGYARVDDEVAELCERASRVFTSLGARVETVERPFDDPTALISRHRAALTHYAFRAFGDDQLALMQERVAQIIRRSRESNAMADYLDLEAERAKFGARLNAFHADYPLLLTPTVAAPPFDAESASPPGYEDSLDWYPFGVPFNFTRQPAASVPCGFTRAGLPVGLQIVGPIHADLLVLQAARAFEQAQPWAATRPSLFDR